MKILLTEGSYSVKNNKVITGPPNRTVLFCSLASVVDVCKAAGGPDAWAVGRPTLHGGAVRYVPLGRHLVLLRFLSHSKNAQ